MKKIFILILAIISQSKGSEFCDKDTCGMATLSNMHRGLTPELIQRAKDELNETEEARIKGVQELKRLIKEEPDFNPCTDDAFLTRFLRARKYDIDRAFNTLKSYYKYKAEHSGVLTDFKPSDFLRNDKVIQGTVLEHRDKFQRVVGYLRLGEVDMDKHIPDDILSYVLLLTEIALESEATQIAGYSMIVDFAGFTLHKARRFASPTHLNKTVSAMQECYPSRIKAFHIVNEPVYIDILHNIIRPFLSEKLKKRFHFHGSNFESLYKFVEQKILPEELGGEQGPSEIYEKKFFDMICEHEDYFVKMNKFGYTGETLKKLTKGNPKAVST